jgi:hypothetical protein
MTEIIRETVKTQDNPVTGSVNTEVTTTQTVESLIYFLFGVLEVLLVFRLIFKMTGASLASSFIGLIYSLSGLFIMPFRGIFHSTTATGVETTAILEPATIVAIVVYALLAWGTVSLVRILSKE